MKMFTFYLYQAINSTTIRHLGVVLISLILFSCGNEPKQSTEEQEKEEPQVLSTANQAPPTKVIQPVVPVGSIGLSLESKTATEGNEICVGVFVSGFTNILSTQYTISWDPTILAYAQVRDFKLPQMTKQNFGEFHSEKGKLPNVWIDNSLTGVSLPDGTKIYEICWVPKSGSKGRSSSIQFTQEPTPFESVNLQEKVLEIIPTHGKIEVK